ncbi:MAG: AtpZ/AtpI family protein [Holophagales bacterium]|nr:AtpZ/AtpI family protein [Holophagales bacterium]
MSTGRKKGQKGLQGVGLGAELAAALIGFTLLGLWIDRSYQTGPWATLVCVGIGLVGGFYNFLRSSLKILRAPSFEVERPDEAPRASKRKDRDE